MRRVLVVGADNFLGYHVLERLAHTAAFVAVVPPGVRDLQAPQLEYDPADAKAFASALLEVDAVIHCVSGAAEAVLQSARETYAAITLCRHSLRVVHVSSMTVYGSAVGRLSEDAPLRADLGPYSRAQLAAERLALTQAHAVILRPGVEYGPGCSHWTGRVGRLLQARRLGDLGAAGDGCCNLLYIDDLVDAVVQALQVPSIEEQCFNLAIARPMTWNEYFVSFARALGATPVRRITRRRLRAETQLLAPILAVGETILRRTRLRSLHLPPPITPSMLAACQLELHLNVERAEHALSLRWTDPLQGLERAADWCQRCWGGDVSPQTV